MQVSRRANSLAIRLAAEARALDANSAPDRAQALESLRALRKPLPPGWSFDRGEANER